MYMYNMRKKISLSGLTNISCLLWLLTFWLDFTALQDQFTHFELCKSSRWEKWATTWQNQQNECSPSEDSDQPGHSSRLIRVFAVHIKKAWVLSYPISAQMGLKWTIFRTIWLSCKQSMVFSHVSNPCCNSDERLCDQNSAPLSTWPSSQLLTWNLTVSLWLMFRSWV